MKLIKVSILSSILMVVSCATNEPFVASNQEKDKVLHNIILNPILGAKNGGFGLTGYVVGNLNNNSILYKAGIRNNDTILSVNNQKFSRKFAAGDLEQLIKASNKLIFEVKSSNGNNAKHHTVVFK